MEESKQRNVNKDKPKEIEFQWFFVSFLVHWKWFVLSIALFLAWGYIQLKYAVPVYNVGSTVVLKGKGTGTSDMTLLEATGIFETNSSLENEMRIMRSRNLIQTVVTQGHLYVKYTVKGKFKDTELYGNGNMYYNASPVKAYVDNNVVAAMKTGIYMTV